MSERSDREPNGTDESDSARPEPEAESPKSEPAETAQGPVRDHLDEDDSDSSGEPESPVQDSQQRRRPRRPATSFEAAPQLSDDEANPVRERPTQMPRTVRFAVIALFILAVLLLLTSALLYFGRDEQAAEAIKTLQEANEKNIPTQAEIVRASAIAAAIQGGLGIFAVVGAWWTRGGKQWARLLSMAVATFVAVLLLQSVFTGAVSITSLIVLVLAVVSLIFLANRATAEWCGAPPRPQRPPLRRR